LHLFYARATCAACFRIDQSHRTLKAILYRFLAALRFPYSTTGSSETSGSEGITRRSIACVEKCDDATIGTYADYRDAVMPAEPA
jgi:hypothetical protein